MTSLRRQFVQGPVALGVGEFGLKVVNHARTRNYGFTDRTGRLRSSIRFLGVQVRGDVATGSVGSNLIYSRKVEYVSHSRYSYLRRAVQELGERELRASLERHVEVWLERQGVAP